MKKLLLSLCCMIVSAFALQAADVVGTALFGPSTGSIKVDKSPATGNDDQGNSWTITTVGTTSFTNDNGKDYSQIGSSKKPASSFEAVMACGDITIKAVEAKLGGFSGTAGNISIKVGDDVVASGTLNATNDVTVKQENLNVNAKDKNLSLSVTDIAKGVKLYYIKYTYVVNDGNGNNNNELTAAGLAFTPATATCEPDESVMGTFAKATDATVTFAATRDGVEIDYDDVIDFDGGDFRFSASTAGTYVITATSAANATYEAGEATLTITVAVKPELPKVVFVSTHSVTVAEETTNTYYALSREKGSANNSLAGVVVEIENNKVQLNNDNVDKLVWTVDEENGYIYQVDNGTNKYLVHTSSTNLTTSTTPFKWNWSETDNYWKSSTDANRTFAYSTSYGFFRAYQPNASQIAAVAMPYELGKKKAELTFSATELDMFVGDEVEVEFTKATTAEVAFSSTDANVAVYADGKVEAKGAGTCTIKAITAENAEYAAGLAEIAVTVSKHEGSLAWEMDEYTISEDDEDSILFTANTDAEVDLVVKQNGEVIESTACLAIFDEENGKVLLRFENAGEYTITASAEATAAYTACEPVVLTLTVTEDKVTNINFTSETEFTISAVNGAALIEATASSGATLTFESDDEDVATVDEYGFVTAVGAGVATITVTAPAVGEYPAAEATVTVTVIRETATLTVSPQEFNLEEGDLESISAETNSTATITYTSSNEAVATVDEDGCIEAVGAGTATITVAVAQTAQYTAKSVEVAVSVKAAQVSTTLQEIISNSELQENIVVVLVAEVGEKLLAVRKTNDDNFDKAQHGVEIEALGASKYSVPEEVGFYILKSTGDTTYPWALMCIEGTENGQDVGKYLTSKGSSSNGMTASESIVANSKMAIDVTATKNTINANGGYFYYNSTSGDQNERFRFYKTNQEDTAVYKKVSLYKVVGLTPTGIEDVKVEREGNGVYYNLQGMPVLNPQHGIFIHNGKKVYIR